MEYRPIPDERSEEFRRFVSYAFSPESGPKLEDEERPHPGERYGLFDGERLLCVCRHYFLDARVRGRDQSVAGLSAVASPPEHRRQGYVADLLEKSLIDYRERDIDFSILWAFKHAFYRRYGWGTINDYACYETSPAVLASAAGPDRGEFKRVEADEWRSLDSIYRTHRKKAEFSLQRPEEWWRRRVFERWGDDPYVYRWDDEDGSRAYIAYTVDRNDEDGETTLQVTDMASRDHTGFRQLLRFLASHESQIDRISFRTAPDCPLFEMVEEPAEIECNLHPGPMFRLVDVERTLERLDPDERLTLAISDPLAPWNDRTFSLSSEGCEPTDAEAMVETSVNTLSQLYAGSQSVESLEEVGELSVREERARPVLESLFPARRVYLGEHF